MAAAPESSKSREDEKVPEWVLAKNGIRLLLNNNAKEAEELFQRYPKSLTMFAGYSFATFLDALMTFEDDKLNSAMSVLKEVERKCTAAQSGWLKSMKTKVFGSGSEVQTTLAENLETQIILADSQVCLAILTFLQQDISGYLKGGWVMRKSWKLYRGVYNDILHLYRDTVGDPQLPEVADVIPAVSSESSCTTSRKTSLEESGSFLPETEHSSTDLVPGIPCTEKNSTSDSPPPLNNGYIKTKISYSHSAILTPKKPNHDDSSGNSSPNSMKNNCSRSSVDFTFLKKSISVNSALSKHVQKPNEWSSKFSPFTSSLSLAHFTSNFHLFSSSDALKNADIDKETVQRLMGAVSFGYGLFQLGMSLLPPSLLRLTNFLGFGGNRQGGIDCLMYARQGIDMRAPLATLALLWYHTIVRPFYALDGSNVEAGVDAASQLMRETEEEYSKSSLFLFFRGRVGRLNSDIPSALRSFQLSVENATQREIKILSLHEVGWCYLIQLDYPGAEGTFICLKSWSRWSKGFYAYMGGICTGACHNSDNYLNVKEIRNTIQSSCKGNQLDDFLMRRAKCCPEDDAVLAKTQPIYWKLLVYEMLYLWNALPSCSNDNIEIIKTDCETVGTTVEPMLGLSKLVLGSCYCIQKRYSRAVEIFKSCLELRKNLANNAEDAHISAFAQYEIGSYLIRNPETKDEGKTMLQQVGSYKDYDFEQRLNVRVHSMLKQL